MAAPERFYAVVISDRGGQVAEVLTGTELHQQQQGGGPFGTPPTIIGSQDGYATRAGAEAEVKNWQNASEPSKLAQTGVTTAPDIPNPFSWIGVIGHWVGDLVKHLTDAAMWKSIGWILLGVLLVVLGIALWVRADVPAALGVAGAVA